VGAHTRIESKTLLLKGDQSKLGRFEKMPILETAMLWRQTIVLRISKSGDALGWYQFRDE